LRTWLCTIQKLSPLSFKLRWLKQTLRNKRRGCPKRAASMYENNKKKVAMQLQA